MGMISYAEALDILRFHDSYTRLEAVIALSQSMERRDWLKVLGNAWSCCDNIWTQRLALKSLIGTKGPIIEMMNEEERKVFYSLDDTITAQQSWSIMVIR